MGLLCIPIAIFQAISPIVTDRPDFTESPVVVPVGSTQIEAGVTHTSARPDTVTSGPELLIRHSMGEKVEVRFGLPDYNIMGFGGQTTRGWSDLVLGAKFQLGPTPSGTDVAVILESSLPTSTNGFGSEVWEPEFKLCASRDLCPGTGLSAMLAAAFIDNGSNRVASWQATLSLGHELSPNTGIFLEYATSFMLGSKTQHFAHTGFVFQPCATSQWDIHFGFDLSNPRSNAFIGLGYAVRF